MPARDHQDLLYLGIGIVLVAAALFLRGRPEAHSAAHEANLGEAGVDRGPDDHG